MGIETFQFAFVTKNGRSQAPANPLDSTLATFTPDPAKDLFMNSGDRIEVSHPRHGATACRRFSTTRPPVSPAR